MGNRVHSGPASGRQGGLHSTIVRCRGATSHSTRIWSRTCAGTRCSHQRRTRATSSSGNPVPATRRVLQKADVPTDQALFLIRPVLGTGGHCAAAAWSVTAPGGTVVPGTAARAQIAAAGGATIVASLGPSVIVGEVDQARGLLLGREPLTDARSPPRRRTWRRPIWASDTSRQTPAAQRQPHLLIAYDAYSFRCMAGEPYTRHLSGKVRELRFHLLAQQTRITYWLAPGRRVILLTVFRKTRNAETAEVARAVHAQKVCEAEHGPAHDTFGREVP